MCWKDFGKPQGYVFIVQYDLDGDHRCDKCGRGFADKGTPPASANRRARAYFDDEEFLT